MSGKRVATQSSSLFSPRGGTLDIDHIMETNPWKKAEKFNKTEMGRIQDVLNQFNSMVLEEKRSRRSDGAKAKERKEKTADVEENGDSSQDTVRKETQKSKKLANSRSTRKSTVRKTDCTVTQNSNTVQGVEKPSKIPRPRKTIDELKSESNKTKNGAGKKEDKGKSKQSSTKRTKTTDNQSISARSVEATAKKNIRAHSSTRDASKRVKKTVEKTSSQAQVAEEKERTSMNFRELPRRNEFQQRDEKPEKNEDRTEVYACVKNTKQGRNKFKMSRSVVSREETTVHLKQEPVDMPEANDYDMTFDGHALANSTVCSHVSTSTMTSTVTSNKTSVSCAKETVKTEVQQPGAVSADTLPKIKKAIESPVNSGGKLTMSGETPKNSRVKKHSSKVTKISEDKHGVNITRHRSSQVKCKDETKRVKRQDMLMTRTIEKLGYHLMNLARAVELVKDFESDSDSDCSDWSSYSGSSCSTHSDFCTCGECTSCSSDEYSEYTINSCSDCSLYTCSDSTEHSGN